LVIERTVLFDGGPAAVVSSIRAEGSLHPDARLPTPKPKPDGNLVPHRLCPGGPDAAPSEIVDKIRPYDP
jgi:hypothetical protein